VIGAYATRVARGEDTERIVSLRAQFFADQIQHGMSSPPLNVNTAAAEGVQGLMESRFALVPVLVKTTEPMAICGYAIGVIKVLPLSHVDPIVAYVQELFVEPAFRGQHLADFLIDALASFFLSKHAARIELLVLSKNEAALRFWKRHGFNERLAWLDRDLAAPPGPRSPESHG
jgi:ribosomal protein S18 acetylase RimI-like enzyme